MDLTQYLILLKEAVYTTAIENSDLKDPEELYTQLADKILKDVNNV